MNLSTHQIWGTFISSRSRKLCTKFHKYARSMCWELQMMENHAESLFPSFYTTPTKLFVRLSPRRHITICLSTHLQTKLRPTLYHVCGKLSNFTLSESRLELFRRRVRISQLACHIDLVFRKGPNIFARFLRRVKLSIQHLNFPIPLFPQISIRVTIKNRIFLAYIFGVPTSA